MTVEELNVYMLKNFTTKELQEVGWTQLTESDRGIYLDRCQRELNNYRFRGRKQQNNQPNAFPRVIDNTLIKEDKIYDALTYMVYSKLREESDTTLNNIKRGIRSISIGKYSESYTEQKNSTKNNTKPESEVKQILECYLFKGVVLNGY